MIYGNTNSLVSLPYAVVWTDVNEQVRSSRFVVRDYMVHTWYLMNDSFYDKEQMEIIWLGKLVSTEESKLIPDFT